METEAEKEAEARMKEFAAVAQANTGADKAVLAMAALDAAQNAERVSNKKKYWVYVLSFSLPPIGLIFAFWYYRYSRKLGRKRIAIICVILTVLGGFALWLSILALASLIPSDTMQQLQTLKPDEIKSLLEQQ